MKHVRSWLSRLLQSGQTTQTFRDLLDALDHAGLWSDIDESKKLAVIRALKSDEGLTWTTPGEGVSWTAGGVWLADGEDLAEGDVEEWLRSMARALADCGVDLRVATVTAPHDEGSPGYSVSVNETTIALYSFADNEPNLPASEDPWMDCTTTPLTEVNRLLIAAGSSRRVAVFWPGSNDGMSVLGEENALRRISESGSWDCVIP